MTKPMLANCQNIETKAEPLPVQFGRYVIAVFFVTLALLLLAFPIARTEYFIDSSRSVLWQAMNYHAHMGRQDCEVVIFGDSTGIGGIDPLVIEAQTGLKTCNLSIAYMAWAASGEIVLDRYLAQNKPPMLIIFITHVRHLHPPTLDDKPGTIDGWLMVDRLMPVRQAAQFFFHYPRLTFVFVAGIWQHILGSRPDLSTHLYQEHLQVLREHHGFYPFAHLFSDTALCSVKLDGPIGEDPAFLPSLQKRYGLHGTQVWLVANPVRSCDENDSLYRAAAIRAGVEPPAVYPPEDFCDWYHLDEKGAARHSLELSARIKKELRAAN